MYVPNSQKQTKRHRQAYTFLGRDRDMFGHKCIGMTSREVGH